MFEDIIPYVNLIVYSLIFIGIGFGVGFILHSIDKARGRI
jgi:hypothetical protein